MNFLSADVWQNLEEQFFEVFVGSDSAFFFEESLGEFAEDFKIGVLGVAFQFAERGLFDLTHTFAGDPEVLSNFLKRLLFGGFQRKAVLDDVLFFVGKNDQEIFHQVMQFDVLG